MNRSGWGCGPPVVLPAALSVLSFWLHVYSHSMPHSCCLTCLPSWYWSNLSLFKHSQFPSLPSAKLRLGVGDGKASKPPPAVPPHPTSPFSTELQPVFLEWDSLLMVALLFTLLLAIPCNRSSWHYPWRSWAPQCHMPHASLLTACQLCVHWTQKSHMNWVLLEGTQGSFPSVVGTQSVLMLQREK